MSQSKHAKVLVYDVLSYVENYYPGGLDVMVEQADSLATTINHILETHPPGVVMSDAYREEFLQTFAHAYVDMLRA